MIFQEYIAAIYNNLKSSFSNAQLYRNSTIIGSVREQLLVGLFEMFPDIVESGWAIDEKGISTGQLDTIIAIQRATRMPAVMGSHSSSTTGFFSNQVISIVETKSGISNEIEKIVSKTWECHRLTGGYRDYSYNSKRIGTKEYEIQFENWMPICIIGNKGFKKSSSYMKHFKNFMSYKFRVNSKSVKFPTEYSQVVPEMLLDIGSDTLIIRRNLNPDLIVDAFGIPARNVTKEEEYTFFTGLETGVSLVVFMYYLDEFRINITQRQARIEAPLLEMYYNQ